MFGDETRNQPLICSSQVGKARAVEGSESQKTCHPVSGLWRRQILRRISLEDFFCLAGKTLKMAHGAHFQNEMKGKKMVGRGTGVDDQGLILTASPQPPARSLNILWGG